MKAVALVNLGTPKTPEPKDVKRYLKQFLLDPRVVDIPYLSRRLLVEGVIIPRRYKESSKSYAKVWTENGSPLLYHTKNVADLLQKRLQSHKVVFAMRYGEPSLPDVLDSLLKENVSELTLIPLFPQYASATTGSIFETFFSHIQKQLAIPSIRTVSSFYDHPLFIKAWCARAKEYPLSSYDEIIFSYHGLPERQIQKADCRRHCLQKGCCEKISEKNRLCYSAHCHQTTKLIAESLGLKKYRITFQSRLGKEKWLEPSTQETVEQLARNGAKNILIFSPSFVADCLETLFEIKVELQEAFEKHGGEKVELVESLNDQPLWIDTLESLAL